MKVLLIEDDENDSELISVQLGRAGFEVVHCVTQTAAYLSYRSAGGPFFAIIVDGCVPVRERMKPKPTLRLVQLLRNKGFEGHIVAAASDPDTRDKQVTAGANFQCKKEYAHSHLKRLANEAN